MISVRHTADGIYRSQSIEWKLPVPLFPPHQKGEDLWKRKNIFARVLCWAAETRHVRRVAMSQGADQDRESPSLSLAFIRNRMSEELHTATVVSKRTTRLVWQQVLVVPFPVCWPCALCTVPPRPFNRNQSNSCIISTKIRSTRNADILHSPPYTQHFKLLSISGWNKEEKMGCYPLFPLNDLKSVYSAVVGQRQAG